MTKLKCKECNCIITEHLENIDKKMKYISCPICNRIFKNPIYDGDKND